MAKKYVLNYWTLPSGNVIVYSADEIFVVSGSMQEVTRVVRSVAKDIRENGLNAFDSK